MTTRWSHMILLVVFCCAGTVVSLQTNPANFDPHCDIHSVNPGRRSPDDMFPGKAGTDWLHASTKDIKEWYDIGKKECEAHLKSARSDLSYGHADFFTDPNNIPMTTHCRGRNTLLDYSGMILWPFGPYKECPTYSKCWFGVLSCGEPKNEHIKNAAIPKINEGIKQFKVPGDIPEFTSWSVRAMSLFVRVIGAELVVPELKYVTLDNKDDVIIGQYVLTRAHTGTKLEMRMFEFYPSLLFKWSESHIRQYGMQNHAVVYLGGSEGRCRPWTKCAHVNNMPVCDEKSFVFNTPAAVTVTDSQARCPKAKETALPLCKVRDSSQPGRWIASDLTSFGPHCTSQGAGTLFHKNAKPNGEAPGHIVKQANFKLSDHHYKGEAWHEASGDPCLVNAPEPEDAGRSHWFYAPYTCKYHFYNSVELHKCLVDQKLTHIHVAGDSMSRDLFAFLSMYLGVPQISEAELKRLTNKLKLKNVQVHSGSIMLSEGYSWDFALDVMKLSEQPPLPNIYITNYGLAHRNWNFPRFQELHAETEYDYWINKRDKAIPMPEFLFFQSAKELSGRRNIGWVGNVFRQDSAYLKRNYTGLGFSELDEYLFSTGRYEYHLPNADGWHFGGTKRQMEVVALFNMVCNDWLAKVKN